MSLQLLSNLHASDSSRCFPVARLEAVTTTTTSPDDDNIPSFAGLCDPLSTDRSAATTIAAMSWISWPSLVPTILIISASLAWCFREPKTARFNLIAAVGVALLGWVVAPDLSREISFSIYAAAVDAVAALRLHLLIAKHSNMLLTGAAVVWYVINIAAVCLTVARALGRGRAPLSPCPAICDRRTPACDLEAYSSPQVAAEDLADPVEACARVDQHPGCRRARSSGCVVGRHSI